MYPRDANKKKIWAFFIQGGNDGTESIRYWTFAEQEAWTQSSVVKYKERWTAIDERTCETCWKLHGKKIPLNDNFFKKGDKFWNLKLDYEDIKGSPLHPNCRCDMIPCVE